MKGITMKKQSGYMGLETWQESDEAANFVFDLQKTFTKGEKAVNKLVEKELKHFNTPYNTDGSINIALALEGEGKNGVPVFSTMLTEQNIANLKNSLRMQAKDALKSDEWDSEKNQKMHMKAFERMIRHVNKIALCENIIKIACT